MKEPLHLGRGEAETLKLPDEVVKWRRGEGLKLCVEYQKCPSAFQLGNSTLDCMMSAGNSLRTYKRNGKIQYY